MELSSLFRNGIIQNRLPNHQFNSQSRASMIALRIEGYTLRDIAKLFGTTSSTVHQIWRRFRDHYDSEPAPRSGAPKKLSEADIRYLSIQIKRDRSVPYFEL